LRSVSGARVMDCHACRKMDDVYWKLGVGV
jgi:hypothetical protein